MHLDTSYSLLIICPMDQKGFFIIFLEEYDENIQM